MIDTTSMAIGMPGIALARREDYARLIEREERVIAEAERMKSVATGQTRYYVPTTRWDAIIKPAKQRLAALKAGLLPVKLAGDAVTIPELVASGVNVPAPIIERAAEAAERFPAAQTHAYGLDMKATAAVRRYRDPVLTMRYGDAEFFLGFWLWLDFGDEAESAPMGFVAPWAEKRGRGRPSKQIAPAHGLLR